MITTGYPIATSCLMLCGKIVKTSLYCLHSSRACRLLDWTAWPYDGYRRSKLEIGSGQVMRVVPLSEDATPKFLKGGFLEAKQQ